MNPGIRTLASATIVLATAIGSSASAATCGDVQFADTMKVAGAPLVLNGLGIRTATMLNVEVYVAGLYVPEKSFDGDAIIAANQPCQMVLKFVQDADAADVRDAFQKGFHRVTGGNLGPLQDRIATLDAQIVDIKEGQLSAVLRYSITSEPSISGMVRLRIIRSGLKS